MLADLLLGNYKTVAERLGLTVGAGRIHGVLQGAPLQVWFGAHSTHIVALLSNPAPIQLSVAAKGLMEKLVGYFGAHSAGIGDPAFDAVFSTHAADPARVAALLDSEARSALIDVAGKRLHPALDANSIHLRRFSQGGLADSEEMIESDFYQATRLAALIGGSFGRAGA